MTESNTEFLGLPDDLARISLQRLMTCDIRWRSYDKAARTWQRVALVLSILATISASLAAVSYVQGIELLAISLSIVVAVFVPLHNTIDAVGRAANNREAATKYELLTNDYERYIQLDLGPLWWRGKFNDPNSHRERIDKLDFRISEISSTAPRVKFKNAELVATETRAKNLVDYLQMENVKLPEREVWAH